MQKRKYIKLAGLLMVLSWLLLAGFVIQWLLARYGTEKEILNSDLNRQFAEANSQVMDSALIINLIDPLINDTKMIDITVNGSGSKASPDTKEPLPATMPFDSTGHHKVYMIHVTDSVPGSSMANHLAKLHGDSGNVVLQSIRLIIAKASDTSKDRSRIDRMLLEKIDTGLFHKLFREKMDRKGLNFTFKWQTHPGSDSSVKHNKGIYLSSKIFEGSIGASVGKFSWYLLRRIIPQILFAIVLLVLTGIAFLFIYRTLAKQALLNELRNGFIGNISHELKTPVATIKVALESLRKYEGQQDAAVTSDYLDMALQEVGRLDQLIGKVLNISVLEENQTVVVLSNADLKASLLKVIRSMKPALETARTEIATDAPDEQYMCRMDAVLMEGVLINLLDNAIKYAGGQPAIEIGLTNEEKSVILTLRDHGPGIPEEYIHKVFDKFFRVPTGDRHNVKGHGLGLSYAAEVMKQHKGSISVENHPEGGCSFKLILPKE